MASKINGEIQMHKTCQDLQILMELGRQCMEIKMQLQIVSFLGLDRIERDWPLHIEEEPKGI
jgi:hypothetical protein